MFSPIWFSYAFLNCLLQFHAVVGNYETENLRLSNDIIAKSKSYDNLVRNLRENWDSPLGYILKRGYMPIDAAVPDRRSRSQIRRLQRQYEANRNPSKGSKLFFEMNGIVKRHKTTTTAKPHLGCKIPANNATAQRKPIENSSTKAPTAADNNNCEDCYDNENNEYENEPECATPKPSNSSTNLKITGAPTPPRNSTECFPRMGLESTTSRVPTTCATKSAKLDFRHSFHPILANDENTEEYKSTADIVKEAVNRILNNEATPKPFPYPKHRKKRGSNYFVPDWKLGSNAAGAPSLTSFGSYWGSSSLLGSCGGATTPAPAAPCGGGGKKYSKFTNLFVPPAVLPPINDTAETTTKKCESLSESTLEEEHQQFVSPDKRRRSDAVKVELKGNKFVIKLPEAVETKDRRSAQENLKQKEMEPEVVQDTSASKTDLVTDAVKMGEERKEPKFTFKFCPEPLAIKGRRSMQDILKQNQIENEAVQDPNLSKYSPIIESSKVEDRILSERSDSPKKKPKEMKLLIPESAESQKQSESNSGQSSTSFTALSKSSKLDQNTSKGTKKVVRSYSLEEEPKETKFTFKFFPDPVEFKERRSLKTKFLEKQSETDNIRDLQVENSKIVDSRDSLKDDKLDSSSLSKETNAKNERSLQNSLKSKESDSRYFQDPSVANTKAMIEPAKVDDQQTSKYSRKVQRREFSQEEPKESKFSFKFFPDTAEYKERRYARNNDMREKLAEAFKGQNPILVMNCPCMSEPGKAKDRKMLKDTIKDTGSDLNIFSEPAGLKERRSPQNAPETKQIRASKSYREQGMSNFEYSSEIAHAEDQDVSKNSHKMARSGLSESSKDKSKDVKFVFKPYPKTTELKKPTLEKLLKEKTSDSSNAPESAESLKTDEQKISKDTHKTPQSYSSQDESKESKFVLGYSEGPTGAKEQRSLEVSQMNRKFSDDAQKARRNDFSQEEQKKSRFSSKFQPEQGEIKERRNLEDFQTVHNIKSEDDKNYGLTMLGAMPESKTEDQKICKDTQKIRRSDSLKEITKEAKYTFKFFPEPVEIMRRSLRMSKNDKQHEVANKEDLTASHSANMPESVRKEDRQISVETQKIQPSFSFKEDEKELVKFSPEPAEIKERKSREESQKAQHVKTKIDNSLSNIKVASDVAKTEDQKMSKDTQKVERSEALEKGQEDAKISFKFLPEPLGLILGRRSVEASGKLEKSEPEQHSQSLKSSSVDMLSQSVKIEDRKLSKDTHKEQQSDLSQEGSHDTKLNAKLSSEPSEIKGRRSSQSSKEVTGSEAEHKQNLRSSNLEHVSKVAKTENQQMTEETQKVERSDSPGEGTKDTKLSFKFLPEPYGIVLGRRSLESIREVKPTEVKHNEPHRLSNIGLTLKSPKTEDPKFSKGEQKMHQSDPLREGSKDLRLASESGPERSEIKKIRDVNAADMKKINDQNDRDYGLSHSGVNFNQQSAKDKNRPFSRNARNMRESDFSTDYSKYSKFAPKFSDDSEKIDEKKSFKDTRRGDEQNESYDEALNFDYLPEVEGEEGMGKRSLALEDDEDDEYGVYSNENPKEANLDSDLKSAAKKGNEYRSFRETQKLKRKQSLDEPSDLGISSQHIQKMEQNMASNPELGSLIEKEKQRNFEGKFHGDQNFVKLQEASNSISTGINTPNEQNSNVPKFDFKFVPDFANIEEWRNSHDQQRLKRNDSSLITNLISRFLPNFMRTAEMTNLKEEMDETEPITKLDANDYSYIEGNDEDYEYESLDPVVSVNAVYLLKKNPDKIETADYAQVRENIEPEANKNPAAETPLKYSSDTSIKNRNEAPSSIASSSKLNDHQSSSSQIYEFKNMKRESKLDGEPPLNQENCVDQPTKLSEHEDQNYSESGPTTVLRYNYVYAETKTKNKNEDNEKPLNKQSEDITKNFKLPNMKTTDNDSSQNGYLDPLNKFDQDINQIKDTETFANQSSLPKPVSHDSAKIYFENIQSYSSDKYPENEENDPESSDAKSLYSSIIDSAIRNATGYHLSPSLYNIQPQPITISQSASTI